jgi:hypothetical protein
MTHKVRCTVTGNVLYMTDKRYIRVLAKYGSEENIKTGYVSMKGRKVLEGQIDPPKAIKNRIKCSITGRWCYITNQRIEAGVNKYGSWEALCENYTCRPAKRLLREGKTEDDIKQMVLDGTFPDK